MAANSNALAADPSLALEAASAPERVGTPVTAAPMWRAATSSDELVTVVVQLQGDSVAEARSQSPDLEISESTRQTIANSLRQQQDGLRSMIEAYGGRVERNFQHAMNGIRVTIPASKLGSLSALPGMVGIKNVRVYEMSNAQSVPYIGAPAVWQGPPGIHGEGIKVAIVDTGLDYTHANFGGPGTAAAYSAAHDKGAETKPADPALFGPAAAKVKGGTDLVGDNYNASARNPDGTVDTARRTPHPDTNPLDCNGHGSHVGGTTAGFGVTTAGATFAGPYDAATPNKAFRIGPGVAPKADLYAVRVFGCAGSTNVVVEALDWAVEHHMDVVNMSLGSDFGTDQSADAIASTNAEKAGVIIVASAGNAGRTVPYIVGSPSVGNRTLSIAAVDSKQDFPGAIVTLTPAATQTWQNSNDGKLPTKSVPIQTLTNDDGTVSLGCLETEYMNGADGSSKVAGNLVLSIRGTCARIYRAQAAFAHGAAGAALINNGGGFPVFEGDIFSCIPGATPDNANGRPCEQQVPANGSCANGKLTGTGTAARCVETPVLVTSAFFGIRGDPSTDGPVAAGSTSADTFTATRVINPTANQIIGFSSSGPRLGYDADGFFTPSGHLKPDLAAPGVSIVSTAVGTGNGAETLSGTSMAAPHVTGVAALARQAHPFWRPDEVRLAIANTANATKITGWSPRQAGAGLVQPVGATRTLVIARAAEEDESNLSFGAADFRTDFSGARFLLVRNLSDQSVSFTASTVPFTGGRAHTATVTPASFTLKKGSSTVLQVSLTVPAATAGSSSAFREVGGIVSLTPAAGSNGGAALSVPYYFVPRARSDVSALLGAFDAKGNATETLKNASTAVTGLADVYSFVANGHANKGAHGIRALGVKSIPCPPKSCANPASKIVTFAVNTFRPNSQYASSTIEYDVDITLAGNTTGKPDFTLFTADLGLVQGAAADGRVVTVLVNNKTGKALLEFLATAPTDGSLILMPVEIGDAGITAASPRFSFSATAFFAPDDRKNSTTFITDTTNSALFNAFTPSITASITGGFPATLAPLEQKTATVTITSEFLQTPARGVMVVARENRNSKAQALLTRFDRANEDNDDEDRDDKDRGRSVAAR